MWTFAGICVVAGALLYVFRALLPRLDKALILREEEIDVKRTEATKPVFEDRDPMPRFMVEWAMNESSEWAREDKLRRMRELYGKLGNWDKVKLALAYEEEVAEKTTY